MSHTRRFVRAATLALRWTRYFGAAPGIATPARDFYAWVRTTWFHDDLPAHDLPWFTFAAARYLRRVLRPGMTVFEWGSGASTIFFARRGCDVTTIEHDPVWAAQLAPLFRTWPTIHLVANVEADPYYSAAIDAQPDSSLDLVVVDGIQRCECFERALAKVRPGGWLLLDDSERALYDPCIGMARPPRWDATHLYGPRPAAIWPVFGRTSLFRRLE